MEEKRKGQYLTAGEELCSFFYLAKGSVLRETDIVGKSEEGGLGSKEIVTNCVQCMSQFSLFSSSRSRFHYF